MEILFYWLVLIMNDSMIERNEELFDLNLVLVMKIWYLKYGSSHVCKAVYDGSRRL